MLGLCATKDAARTEIKDTPPPSAVVDNNLHSGWPFEPAGDFKRDDVPSSPITGDDQKVIPERFEKAACLQEPVEFRHVIGTLADTLGM